MRTSWIIARKDLLERIRDRSALIISVLVPLGLAFILNATIGAASEGFSFSFAVADADGGGAASGLLEVLDGMELQGFATIRKVPEAEARELADQGDVSASILIPDGFSEALQAGTAAELIVVRNPDATIGSEVARSIVDGFASELNAIRLSVAAVVAGRGGAVDAGELAALGADAASTSSPVTVVDESTQGGSIDFATFYATGIAVFFVFFTVQFGVLSLIEEREEGTMQRLIAAPIRPASIVLGKVMAAFVLGAVSMIVLWAATSLVMGAKWGNPIGVLALIVSGVVAAMGVTALVASFAKTAEQAGGYASAAAVVLGILGGTFFPVSQASGFLAKLSFVTPHRWLMDGFRNLASGDGALDVLPQVGAVVAFGVVTGAIGLSWASRLVRQR